MQDQRRLVTLRIQLEIQIEYNEKYNCPDEIKEAQSSRTKVGSPGK